MLVVNCKACSKYSFYATPQYSSMLYEFLVHHTLAYHGILYAIQDESNLHDT